MLQCCDCFVSSYFLKFSSWRMTESLCPWQKGAKPCLRSNDPKGGVLRRFTGRDIQPMPKAPDLRPVGCGAFASQGNSLGSKKKLKKGFSRTFPDICNILQSCREVWQRESKACVSQACSTTNLWALGVECRKSSGCWSRPVRCKGAMYCDEICQRRDLPRHRLTCESAEVGDYCPVNDLIS